ncbi:hypothetical protein LQV05_002423 [Cryptococcus neoformans]|nr:hypothetical protein LQV05_002423 [Cryptococcus neoformans]
MEEGDGTDGVRGDDEENQSGTEPIVRAAERALEGSLGAEYTHLASLDATNAFNRVDRKVMADAVEKHAPVLWRTCKWAYGEPSDLICGDTILQSSQGVRQGDPFGPLFFSIALRPTLHALSIALGPDTQAVAYLDDIYLFSNDPNVMQRTQAFLADKENVIKLNNNKCKQVTFTEMAENGFKMLGTMVGPKKAREEFLKGKMESEARKIARLKDLPSQHALLLLRLCIQQNLRHLQRSLRTDDLKTYWERMDQELWGEVQRMRTRQIEGSKAEDTLGKQLSHLPARFGGLGLLSFTDVAPLAYKAAAAQADKHLANIFALDLPDKAPTPSQRELCSSMWEHQQTTILEGLNDPGRKRLVENASRIGKRWLNVVPHFQPLRLSNQEVATGLHDRTLVGSSLAICSFCGSDSPLGHDELCRSRNSWAQRRHDSINRIIHRGLQSVEGAVVSIEPRTLEGQRRNDLRVRGRCGLHATDYDLKVYCLNDRDARSTTSAKSAASSLTNHVLNRCLSWLDKVSENATRKAPATHSGLFKAVVLSTGGLVSRETADEMRRWRKEMGPMAFEGMMKKISLELSLLEPVTGHHLNRAVAGSSPAGGFPENATRKAPATHSGLFKAVVLSTGGLVSRETADEMRRWRKEMGPMAFEGMMKKISLELGTGLRCGEWLKKNGDFAPIQKFARWPPSRKSQSLGLLSSPEEPPTPVPQRIRCAELWESQQEAILHNLGDTERKRLTENASRLGRSWLSVIPYLQPLRLSNVEIASGLHDRTLVGSSIPVCRFCGSDSPLGHDELCRARNPWTQRRHNAINRVIFQHLKQIQGATVEIEPHTLSGQRRNDLRVRGSGALAFADYDLKVYSLGDRDARSTVPPCSPNSKLAEFCLDRCINWLDKVGQVVAQNAPKLTGGVFKPIILSTGGLVSKSTADEWKDWREAMPAGAFERMEKRIGVELVKARARTLVL